MPLHTKIFIGMLTGLVLGVIARNVPATAAAIARRSDLTNVVLAKLFQMNSRKVYRALATNTTILPRGPYLSALARSAQMDHQVAWSLAARDDFDCALLAPAFFDLNESDRIKVIQAFSLRKTPDAPIKKTIEQLSVATGELTRALMKLFSENRRPEITTLLNQITGLDPGEVFVHRNVANLAPPQDANYLSVLQFSVEVLKVRHILVVGHYGCGGIAAAIDGQRRGLIDHWLHPIRETYGDHVHELEALPEGKERLNRLCELNVLRQVRNVASDVFVQDAWARGQKLSVHGWVYSLANGLVTDLDVTVGGPADVDRLL